MASLSPSPSKNARKTKTTPPSIDLKILSRDPGGPSPSPTPKGNFSWIERRHSVLQLVNHQDTSPAYNHVPPSSYIFKMTQMILTIVSTGAYSKGVNGVTSSTTAQMFPYFVCSAYMIITPVILISYVLGHRMPEILIRIFNTLGGILFLVAGTVALLQWRDFRSDIKGKQDDVDKQKAAVFLLTTGVLCLVNSMFYLFDVAISVHSTLSSARRLRKGTKLLSRTYAG